MNIKSLDHLVLTSPALPKIAEFYSEVLGMEKEVFGEGRLALKFGSQKINLHSVGEEIAPHARNPGPGSLDICLIVESSIDVIQAHLAEKGIVAELGPVRRTGALGPIDSIYIRDPDGNLVELSTYGGVDP